jgi:membrane protease YdiL (CAAX protease family)
LGIGILATMILGWVRNGPPSFSNWQVSWNWEIILQVFVIGFFLLSQGVVLAFSPLLLKAFSLIAPENDLLLQSIRVLITYFLMAIVGLGFLYFSLKPYLPLDSQWFKFDLKSNWIGQAIAGYLVALPLVVLVSLLNQQIWQGQGGSNPLLFLAIEAQNGWVIFIFFITAALAAPFYEEILFRGFLLPSLTAYMSTWKAILLSAVIFALAHLNLSEVLPLSVLGIILGFVYQRNRNLLASMLLHSLWNSGTLLSLFLLGNS